MQVVCRNATARRPRYTKPGDVQPYAAACRVGSGWVVAYLTTKAEQKMSTHSKKQFGIWMDAHHATIVGRDTTDPHTFVVMGHVKHAGASGNSNEHAANQHESTQRHSYFKDIAATMVNVDEVHITGTGQAQEQFMKFLADTPQYKNAVASESTSNKMEDDQLVAMISARFN